MKRLEVPSEECSDCLEINNNPKFTARSRRIHRKRGCRTPGCRNYVNKSAKNRLKGIAGA